MAVAWFALLGVGAVLVVEPSPAASVEEIAVPGTSRETGRGTEADSGPDAPIERAPARAPVELREDDPAPSSPAQHPVAPSGNETLMAAAVDAF